MTATVRLQNDRHLVDIQQKKIFTSMTTRDKNRYLLIFWREQKWKKKNFEGIQVAKYLHAILVLFLKKSHISVCPNLVPEL